MKDSPSSIARCDNDSPQAVDIVRRLRQANAGWLGTDDEDQYWACHEAAAEIERLRWWGGLTDAERDAIESAAHAVAQLYVGTHGVSLAATLRALLARIG